MARREMNQRTTEDRPVKPASTNQAAPTNTQENRMFENQGTTCTAWRPTEPPPARPPWSVRLLAALTLRTRDPRAVAAQVQERVRALCPPTPAERARAAEERAEAERVSWLAVLHLTLNQSTPEQRAEMARRAGEPAFPAPAPGETVTERAPAGDERCSCVRLARIVYLFTAEDGSVREVPRCRVGLAVAAEVEGKRQPLGLDLVATSVHPIRNGEAS